MERVPRIVVMVLGILLLVWLSLRAPSPAPADGAGGPPAGPGVVAVVWAS